MSNSIAPLPVRSVPLIKADLPDLDVLSDLLGDVLTTGRVTNFGKHVVRFEQEAGAYLGTQVATTSSGTMGLIFMQALGLERGQKVIIPSFTFVATAQAVLYAGGVPLFAEVREDVTLDPRDVEKLLEQQANVGAVIGVHTYGLPCQVDEIQLVVEEARRKHGRPIPLVYDEAHLVASAANGRRIGTFRVAPVHQS